MPHTFMIFGPIENEKNLQWNRSCLVLKDAELCADSKSVKGFALGWIEVEKQPKNGQKNALMKNHPIFTVFWQFPNMYSS